MWLRIAIASGGYAALSGVTLAFVASDHSNTLTLIWSATSWLCAWLLLLPSRRERSIVVVLGALADICGLTFVFQSFAYAAPFALINMVSPLICFVLIRKLCGPEPLFETISGLLTFVALVPVGSLVSALSGLTLSYVTQDGNFGFAYFKTWFVAEVLGVWTLLPPLVMLATQSVRTHQRSTLEAIVLPLATCVLVAIVLATQAYQLLIVAMPLLVAIAFRLGRVHAAMTTLIISIIAFHHVATTHPIVAPGDVVPPVLFVQLFIAVSFLASLPAATAVSEQARLRARLEEEQQSASEARQAAEAASVAKSEFVANMSHELRSPLNSIVGFTYLLERRDLDADARREVSLIRVASRALLTVVNDVLDFSALEQGRLQLVPVPFALSELVNSATGLIEPLAHGKGLAIYVRGDDLAQDALVVGDPDRLRQVLLNLMSKAVKFTEHGHVALEVTATPVEDGGERRVRLHFAVSDTGAGISAADQVHLFHRFRQLDSARRRRHGGSGLGLSICKQLVDAMAGRIGVTSTVGEGSTFWFDVSLPARSSDATGEGPEQAMPEATKGVKVLIVDDLEFNREVAQAILQQLGYSAQCVESGAQALDAIKRERFDAVLMDVQMPDMDGFETTQRIRQADGDIAAIPVIAMTANAAADEVERCLAAGMNAHIGKPFEPRALVSAIEDQLNRRRRAA